MFGPMNLINEIEGIATNLSNFDKMMVSTFDSTMGLSQMHFSATSNQPTLKQWQSNVSHFLIFNITIQFNLKLWFFIKCCEHHANSFRIYCQIPLPKLVEMVSSRTSRHWCFRRLLVWRSSWCLEQSLVVCSRTSFTRPKTRSWWTRWDFYNRKWCQMYIQEIHKNPYNNG